MMDLTDHTEIAKLVKRAQAGSKEAFGMLYKQYCKPLRYFALKRLHSEEDADDAVQETFLYALVKITDLRNPQAFHAWIYRVAARCINMAQQRSQQEAEIFVSESDLPTDEAFAEIVGPDESEFLPEEALDNKEERELLLAAVENLSDAQREAVVLRYFSGFAPAEIATILDTNTATVNKRLYDARIALRKSISKITGEKAAVDASASSVQVSEKTAAPAAASATAAVAAGAAAGSTMATGAAAVAATSVAGAPAPGAEPVLTRLLRADSANQTASQDRIITRLAAAVPLLLASSKPSAALTSRAQAFIDAAAAHPASAAVAPASSAAATTATSGAAAGASGASAAATGAGGVGGAVSTKVAVACAAAILVVGLGTGGYFIARNHTQRHPTTPPVTSTQKSAATDEGDADAALASKEETSTTQQQQQQAGDTTQQQSTDTQATVDTNANTNTNTNTTVNQVTPAPAPQPKPTPAPAPTPAPTPAPAPPTITVARTTLTYPVGKTVSRAQLLTDSGARARSASGATLPITIEFYDHLDFSEPGVTVVFLHARDAAGLMAKTKELTITIR